MTDLVEQGDQSLQDMSDDEVMQKLKQGSGEPVNQGLSMNFDIIQFKGDSGMYKKVMQDEPNKEIGSSIEAVIIKSRNKIRTFSDEDPSQEFYSKNEFDDIYNEPIELYNGLDEKVDEHNYKVLKEKYDISLRKVLYLMDEDGDLAKMDVSGTSLGNYFTYENSFPENESMSAYYTKFSNETRHHEKWGEFYVVKLQKGEKADPRKCLKVQKEINKMIEARKQEEQVVKAESQGERAKVKNQAQEGSEPEEEIEVEDIPF